MIFDLDLYRVHFEGLKMALEPIPPSQRLYWASFYAAANTCPIIAALHYTAEIYGMDAGIEANLATVIKLYSITEVVGVRHGV